MIGPNDNKGYWKKSQKKGKRTLKNATPNPKKFFFIRQIGENYCVLSEIQNFYDSKKYDLKIKKFSELEAHLFFLNIDLLEDDKIKKKSKEDLLKTYLAANLPVYDADEFSFFLVEISAKHKNFTIEDMVTKKDVEDISITVISKNKAEQIGKVFSSQIKQMTEFISI